MKHFILCLGLTLLTSGCNDTATVDTPNSTERDNTAVNERDTNDAKKTPFDQSNDEADIDLVAKIRADVMDIDDLSTNGKNVKIITNNNQVTLRGPVGSVAEKEAIEKIANEQVGAENVTSELEIEAN